MKRELPRYVYPKKGKGGTVYHYFIRGRDKPVRMPDPADPAFWTVYAGLVKGREPLPTGRSFKALIQSYERSERFQRLKPRTQQDYGKVLAWIETTLGQLPSDKMQRKDVIRAQTESIKGVRFANYIVQILGVLFEHAIDIGWREDNPAKGVRLLQTEKKAPHVPWTPEAMKHWRENAGELELQIFEIGLCFGQRPGDWPTFVWKNFDGMGLWHRQGKTGKCLYIPCTTRMQKFLRDMPRQGLTMLLGPSGQPLRYQRMAAIMRAERMRLGLKKHDLHALRYNATMELAEAGCSRDEIKAITGHTTDGMVNLYGGEVWQMELAKKAQEKRK